MELRHLRYFVAVAERLNFTEAARHLGMAQPPLSVQIRKLEEEIGCQLFNRRNRRIELTPSAHLFLVHARDVLERADQAIRHVQDHVEGRAGEVSLAWTDGALSERLTRRLRKFLRKHRGLRLHVRRAEYGARLTRAREGADGMITEFSTIDLPSEAIPLERSPVQVAVHPKHRLSDRNEFVPADLVGETLILSPFEQRTPGERSLLDQIEAADIKVSVLLGPTSLQDRFWQASLGLGICVCTGADRGGLDCKRLTWSGSPVEIVTALLLNPDSRASALPALIEAIRE
ncbi:MAG: LysR family transcriptional regulator [Terrimicrobiaceae bacterium]|nr:LysR family transcriptional regulator [Terrimicrobiaceae bacterium]